MQVLVVEGSEIPQVVKGEVTGREEWSSVLWKEALSYPRSRTKGGYRELNVEWAKQHLCG